MRNRLHYSLLFILVTGKVFAWWLLFWGTNMQDIEVTLKGVFEPVHQFSYMILSSFLLVSLLFKSRFALFGLFAAFIINTVIYLYRGTAVYQSVWDFIIVLMFCMLVYYRQPNSWHKLIDLQDLQDRHYP